MEWPNKKCLKSLTVKKLCRPSKILSLKFFHDVKTNNVEAECLQKRSVQQDARFCISRNSFPFSAEAESNLWPREEFLTPALDAVQPCWVNFLQRVLVPSKEIFNLGEVEVFLKVPDGMFLRGNKRTEWITNSFKQRLIASKCDETYFRTASFGRDFISSFLSPWSWAELYF